ncbi:MAG: aminopeptidase P family N-terminal domain-containing protein, partial [Planctomycetaceae bacterium]
MPDRFAARREKLIRQVRKSAADALLVTNETNVRYLTGFTGDSTYLLIGPSVLLLISDGRYTVQLQEECPGIKAHIRTLEQKLHEAAGEVLRKSRLKSIGFESDSVSHALWE